MIGFIEIYIQNIVSIVPDSLVSNVREMIGISENNNKVQTFKDLIGKLIGLSGDEQLLMCLTGTSETDKSRVIFQYRFSRQDLVTSSK